MPYTLNGQPLAVPEEPHEQSGVLYVPFKQVIDALGGSVTWDNETKTAAGTVGQWTAQFMLASETADVNGTTVTFSSPSYVDGGELFVPADFLHNAYGYTVQADGTNVALSV